MPLQNPFDSTNISAAITTTRTTIFDEVEIIETHIHNRERWFGKSADQSGDDWGIEAGLTPYQAISGNGDFGGDANDEAKVLGSEDTSSISGMTYFDPHRILVITQSVTTAYILRVIYGTGTMAAAESAGQYSDVPIISDTTKQNSAGGRPLDMIMPRCAAGCQIWIRIKNATDNATLDFLFGIHEYAE